MSRLLTALVTLLLPAIFGEALAQSGDNRSRGGASSERPAVTRTSTSEQMRMQLNSVRAALKLAPEQNPLWQTYEDRVADLLSDLSRSANPPPGENAIQQIDRKVDTVRNRLAAMEDLSDAAKKLYAALSGEQREAADRMLAGTVPALYSGQSPSFRGDGPPPRGDGPPSRDRDRTR
jgi:hypothetical protein